jgi:hypothetical protein
MAGRGGFYGLARFAPTGSKIRMTIWSGCRHGAFMWLIDPCLVARFGAALVSELMKLASNCRAAFEGQSNQETEREALEAAIAKVAQSDFA